MSLTGIVFWVIYLGGVCAALVNPVMGVALYVFVYHVNPETQWWGEAARSIGLRSSLTVVVAVIVGLLLRRPRLAAGQRQLPLPYLLALALGLVAVATFAIGFGYSARGEYQAWKYLKLMVMLFIVLRCTRAPADYHLIFYAWLFGTMYMGYQASGGAGRSYGGRLTSGIGGPDFDDSSSLAAHLVATLPLIGAAFFTARSWLGRLVTLAMGALTCNMLIMTRTRNALVGLVVMAVSTLFHLPRGYRLKGTLAVVAGTWLALQLTDPGWWERMRTITTYRDDPSAVSRLSFWHAALQMALDHPLGIGLGNFHTVVRRYIPSLTDERSAHNTFATCLAELGWAGLLLLLTVLLICVLRLAAIRRLARDGPGFIEIRALYLPARFHLGWHALALQSALLGYCACALFTTRLFAEDLWLLLGMAMALANVAAPLVAERTAPRPAGIAADAPPPLCAARWADFST